MFTQSLKLEVKGSEDRVHRYYCEPTSPGGEILDVLSTMKSVVLKQMQDQNQRELEAAEKLKEDCCKPNEECSKQYEEYKESIEGE